MFTIPRETFDLEISPLTPQTSSAFVPNKLSECTGVTTQRTSNVLVAFLKNQIHFVSVYFFTKLGITWLRVTAKANLEALRHLCRLASFKAEEKNKTR